MHFVWMCLTGEILQSADVTRTDFYRFKVVTFQVLTQSAKAEGQINATGHL